MKYSLSTRGIAIHKSELSAKEEERIRKDLMVSPFIPMNMQEISPFPIYRESKLKMYVPNDCKIAAK